MRQDERDGRGSAAALVDKMNANAIDGSAIVVEGGKLFKLSFPVELILPVVADLAHESEIDTVLPARAGYFVRPPSMSKPVPKVVDGAFGIGQRKRFDAHAMGCSQVEGTVDLETASCQTGLAITEALPSFSMGS